MNFVTKTAYILVTMLFAMYPFAAIVLEPFGIFIVTHTMVNRFQYLTILVCLLGKKWKLATIAVVAPFIAGAIVIGLSEFLGYYLEVWFGFELWF